MRWTLRIAMALVPCVTHANSFPSIEIHGQRHESACNVPPWNLVQASLEEAAAGRSPKDLSLLVRTWLCGNGTQADATVRKSAKAKIPVVSEQTGIVGKERRHVDRSSLSALGGKAWEASVDAEGGRITVSYSPNEACAASGTFAYTRGKWLLVAIGESCD